MLRVLINISRDVQAASGSQARREKVESVRPDYAAMLVLTGATRRGCVFVRAALGPGIREKHADLVETRFGRHMRLQQGDGVDAADLDVFGVRLGQTQQRRSHARPMDLDAQVVCMRPSRCHAGETLAVTKPNVQHARASCEEVRGIQSLVPGHVNAVARPQIAERGLLAPRALALPS